MKGEFDASEQQLHQDYNQFIELNRSAFLYKAEKCLQNPNFQQITAAYELPVDKANSQFIELLARLENDFFNKLRQQNHEGIEVITELVEVFGDRMLQLFCRQSDLSEKFKEFACQESRLQEIETSIEETFIRLRDLQDDEAALKEAKEPGVKGYEETVKKLQMHETITNILQKYEYVLKSQNDSLSPPSDLLGSSLLMTYLLAYLPLLE
jgi:hypothetical protein